MLSEEPIVNVKLSAFSFDTGYNTLTGRIPTEIGLLENLQVVHLSKFIILGLEIRRSW